MKSNTKTPLKILAVLLSILSAVLVFEGVSGIFFENSDDQVVKAIGGIVGVWELGVGIAALVIALWCWAKVRTAPPTLNDQNPLQQLADNQVAPTPSRASPITRLAVLIWFAISLFFTGWVAFLIKSWLKDVWLNAGMVYVLAFYGPWFFVGLFSTIASLRWLKHHPR